MAPARSRFALRLLPSMTDFAFLMPIVFLFSRMGGAHFLLNDSDTGWHIRTGEWILAHHRVPTQDPFSFSKPGATWFAWEWLSDVLYAWLHAMGGLAAVVLFSVVILAITWALLFRLVRRKANPLIAIEMTIMAGAASAIHWVSRPHLFTLLFLVVFYGILERVREGRTHFGRIPCLAVLPLLTVLWTNLHGGFFVGLLLLAGYFAGDALHVLFETDRKKRRERCLQAEAYFLTALACLAASLVNPYFYRLHVHIVQYLADPYQVQNIAEFFTLNFHHPLAIFFEILVLAGAAASFWYISKRRFTEPILLLMWAHAGLLSARNIPLFMVIASVPVAAAMEEWLALAPRLEIAGWLKKAVAKFMRVAQGMAELDDAPRWYLTSAAGVALLAALLYAPAPPEPFRAEYNPANFPTVAVAHLPKDPSTRIFTNDVWGGYLIYRLYPQTKVFFDNRSDFYGAEFSLECLHVLRVKYDWEKTLGRFGVNTILLPTTSPLSGALKESSRWRVVYDDGVALVFRPSSEPVGRTFSAAASGGGMNRDREITNREARDRAIAQTKPRT